MAAKKGGLGKGLDSLLVNKVNADHSSDSTIVKEKSTTTKKKSTKKETPDTMVKLSLVEPNREQPRKHFDEDGLLELAESIKQYGILQPLLVQESRKTGGVKRNSCHRPQSDRTADCRNFTH